MRAAARPGNRAGSTSKDELLALRNIGPAMRRDFALLGIRSVAQLARRRPERLYVRLEQLTGARQDGRVPFVPGVQIALKSLKRLAARDLPQPLGELIRRKREELGLRQIDLARELGVSEFTVVNWETGRNTPRDRLAPKVFRFLTDGQDEDAAAQRTETQQR